MSRRTQHESFAPTQPLPEYQDLLHEQGRRAKNAYTPNHVPFALRLFCGLISLGWVSWAMIGLLSGHMFTLFFTGFIHFMGIPAIIFSAAVLASAMACTIPIVDHYDKRNNEAAYQRFRRRLWWSALGLFFVAYFVGFAERMNLLPYTDGSVGLLSTTSLKSLLQSNWLAIKLASYAAEIDFWMCMSFIWCIVGLLIMNQLGFLKEADASYATSTSAGFAITFFIFPALSTFTLYLIYSLVTGDLTHHTNLSENELRSKIAWIQSMLLACLAALSLFLFVIVITVLRAIGIIPPLPTQQSDTN